MIRILIADDHAVVRRGLRQTVSEEPDMTVVGEASNVPELLSLARKVPCDVVVLDISMPGRSGLDALKELRQECPRLPVLVLSMHPEDQYALRTLRIGAAGYLTKDTAPEELVKAIRKAVSGGKYVTPSIAEKLALGLAKDSARPLHEALSEREYQVMCLIASGKSVTEISVELSLSVKTISTYRARILEKMNLKNNAELVHYAVFNQLVD